MGSNCIGNLIMDPEMKLVTAQNVCRIKSLFDCLRFRLQIKAGINQFLPVVLYGCETWSLTLREEHRLRVFENRVLRRIFGPKNDEVTREWRKLHDKELHDLYSLPIIIRIIKSR
jgi:hypothetical protein